MDARTMTNNNQVDVAEITAILFVRGAFLLGDLQAGRHCPAVSDGYSFEVCRKNGAPLVLCHDEVQAAAWLMRLHNGVDLIDITDHEPIRLISAEDRENDAREDRRRDIEWSIRASEALRERAKRSARG